MPKFGMILLAWLANFLGHFSQGLTSRERPFGVVVNAVVSVVLFDQNLDPTLDPNLHQTPGQNLDQALGQIW